MTVQLGEFGVWRRVGDIPDAMAAEIESLGYGAIWVGGSPPGDLQAIERILDVTETISVVTGIVNMWRDEATAVSESYLRIADRHPHRFLLGVGVGHPEATVEYSKPLNTINRYLDQLEEAGLPPEAVVLAALGPKALTIAAERTAGAHPYLTTPRHTRLAREVMGDDPLVAPEHKVILDTDEERARSMGRSSVGRYLRLVNYRNSLRREGWDETDIEGGGSDRLVDALVLHGTVNEVGDGLKAHLAAGADHVGIQPLGDDPLADLRELAPVLLG